VAAGFGFSVGLATDGMLRGEAIPAAAATAGGPVHVRDAAGLVALPDTDYFYVPDERLRFVTAGAFQIVAIAAGPGDTD
jgi:hypothetical protein